jgi:hypothetical protein
MSERTATPSNVVDVTPRLRQRAIEEAGRRLNEQLMAEAAEYFAAFDWRVKEA